MWKGRYRHDAKKIAAGLAVLLAAGTILGGCGESGAAGNDSVSDAAGNEAAALTEAKTTPYGRYPETITYTLAKMTGVNNSNLPEGETYEDNAYTRLIREIINVQNEDVYENYGDTYNVGISTMIATGNIADIMVVDQKTMNAMQKTISLPILQRFMQIVPATVSRIFMQATVRRFCRAVPLTES